MSTFTPQPFVGSILRRNMCTNPRVGVDTTSWGAFAGTGGTAAISRVTGQPLTRPTAARATWSVATTAVTGGLFCAVPTVTAGQTFVASVDAAPSIAQKLVASIEWKNASNTIISTTSGTITTFTAGQVQRLTVSGTAPALTVSANVTIYAATGGVVWSVSSTLTVTALLFEGGTVAGTYFDGATTDVSDLDIYRWSGIPGSGIEGTPDASTSDRVTPQTTEQITPLFGPITPTEYSRASHSIVHQALEDPSVIWITGRNPGLRSGEWTMLFDTAAKAKSAVDAFAGGTTYYFDGDGDLSQLVRRFITPQGQQVTMRAVENTPNAAGTEWVYEVVVPWQEVS